MFFQLWAIYVPGDDRKWKSYFILQINLIVNDSSMYFFDLIMFNQSVDLLRQKMTNFCLVMYTRFLKKSATSTSQNPFNIRQKKTKTAGQFSNVYFMFYPCPSESFKPKIWKSTIKMWIILCHYNQAKYHFFIVRHFQSSHNLVKLCKQSENIIS